MTWQNLLIDMVRGGGIGGGMQKMMGDRSVGLSSMSGGGVQDLLGQHEGPGGRGTAPGGPEMAPAPEPDEDEEENERKARGQDWSKFFVPAPQSGADTSHANTAGQAVGTAAGALMKLFL